MKTVDNQLAKGKLTGPPTSQMRPEHRAINNQLAKSGPPPLQRLSEYELYDLKEPGILCFPFTHNVPCQAHCYAPLFLTFSRSIPSRCIIDISPK